MPTHREHKEPIRSNVRVWAILGDQNAGKSTTISYLISQFGRGRGGFRYVQLRGGGYLYVFAHRQAEQEANRKPPKTIERVEDTARGYEHQPFWINVLLALRYDGDNGCPGAREYLSAFVSRGWHMESLVLLNYDDGHHEHFHFFGAPTLEIPDASVMAQDESQHGHLVGRVRNHFGWA